MLDTRILIFEPNHKGHHLHYVKVLIEALREQVSEIIVVLDAAAEESAEFSVHLRPLQTAGVRFRFDVQLRAKRNSYGLALEAAVQLIRATFRYHPARVYIPYADGLLQVLGLVSRVLPRRLVAPVPIEALMMRGAFAYPMADLSQGMRLNAAYKALCCAPVDILHVLDPLVLREIKRRGGQLAECARLVPEAVEGLHGMTREEGRARLGIPILGSYAVCAGSLDTRKGVDHLLRAALAVPMPSSCRLLLVGKVASDVQVMVEEAKRALGTQLIVLDRYVDEQDFAAAIAAADTVVVPYPRHQGSSGLLVRAAALRKYLVSTDYGWIGWSTSTFGLGCVVDVTNPYALGRALCESLVVCHDHQYPANAMKFVAYHTAENQRAHWCRGLRESLGVSLPVATEWPLPT